MPATLLLYIARPTARKDAMTREQEILTKIRSQLERVKDVLVGYTVYLFGSRARG